MTVEAGEPDEHKELGDVEALLEYLKHTRGFDFTGYKRTTLTRRIAKRLQMVGCESFADYIDYLEVHPEEFGALFDTILINVTAFFRDQPAWQELADEVIPDLVAAKPAGSPIRVWSAGCASGEEAYTLAIALAETLGPDEFRGRVKIYGTDVDEDALAKARSANYSIRETEGVPPGLLEKYFEPTNGTGLGFRKDLRRSVIFGRHDLIQDAPISRLDLLVCRNTLMYLNAETQARILDRFHFALNERGVMFLGKAETLLTYSRVFEAVDLKRRIFTKLARSMPRDRLSGSRRLPAGESQLPPADPLGIRDATLESGLLAQLAVDRNGTLVVANAAARSMFGLNEHDLGRPLQDLEVSYRPVELRSCIDQAYATRGPILLRQAEWVGGPSDVRFVDVAVVPLNDGAGGFMGVTVTVSNVTDVRRLQDDLQHSNEELEQAYEALQSTNEELETTNEELQSTIEELETTNEELQSTNEELETMNEELQSTNEELETINDELRQRSAELDELNTFFHAVLFSIRWGVVVLDPDLRVRVWNRGAEELWGMRADEVRNEHFLNLDIGLPVAQLRPAIRAALAGNGPVDHVRVQAVNRRGKSMVADIECSPLTNAAGESRGAILIMDELPAEEA